MYIQYVHYICPCSKHRVSQLLILCSRYTKCIQDETLVTTKNWDILNLRLCCTTVHPSASVRNTSFIYCEYTFLPYKSH